MHICQFGRRALVLALMFVLCALQGRADERDTAPAHLSAPEFSVACTSAEFLMKSEDHDIKETGSFNFGLCLGAIAGVVDAVALERAELGAATPFCPPGSVKVPELLRVVVAYLHARRDHK